VYQLVYHNKLTIEKWFSYSSFQQILMIANELNRAQNALEKYSTDDATHAWERVFELTDLTVEDPKNSRMQRELLRFREMPGETFITLDPAATG